jgi:glyoxylate reductase
MTALRSAGRVHVPADLLRLADLHSACSSGEFDVVAAQLSNRFDSTILGDAKIAGISNYAVGYDNVDVDAATKNNIVVGNTPGVLTDATADLTMLLILAAARPEAWQRKS